MNDQRELVHPRDEIMQTMDRIYRYRMTTTSGGNLSIRDAAGDIWISPARVDKGNLTRNDIVCVRADGTIEGYIRHHLSFRFTMPSMKLGLTFERSYTLTRLRWWRLAFVARFQTQGCSTRLIQFAAKPVSLLMRCPAAGS